jgi:hypothetical protein
LEAIEIRKILLKMGKSWVSMDRTGIMGWDNFNNKNFYFIWGK